MIPRIIESSIRKRLFKGKAIVLTGPRQVGKTTLLKALQATSAKKTLWLNCDESDIRSMLSNATSTQLKEIIGDHELVLMDEVQRVQNIGLTLKLIVDNLKGIQIIATGSSSLELTETISEPLTGRKWEYQLFPLSTLELSKHTSELEEKRLLEQRLIFGYYPEVINHPADARAALLDLSGSYLYKDLLKLGVVRKPVLLEKILIALALQVGNEVSFAEIAQLTGADRKTIEQYVQLLEKCFVVFQLSAFSRNIRNEIKKSRKVYFYDNGIRNAIIKNFNPPGLRQDVGALWENYLISERKKINSYFERAVNTYFWRTHSQQEIDYIEESGEGLQAFEFKWNTSSLPKIPDTFLKAYSNTSFRVIHPLNYMPFAGVDVSGTDLE